MFSISPSEIRFLLLSRSMVCSLRASQRIHGRFRSIEDQRLAASHSIQKGDIEPHDAEPDYADFVHSINHKMAASPERIRLYRRYHRR